MSRFFIDRPIFAWAIAIAICIAGAVSIFTMPVEQYPKVAPPSITISASYPGASSKTVESSVTQIIEQKLTGLDNLRYIESSSSSDGSASITLTFNSGTDADIAQVQVQNKVQSAQSLLPQSVQNQGVTVGKASSSFLLIVGLYSDNDDYSGTDLSDYVFGTLQDPISRVNGVGNVQSFGSQYSMRIWLDADKLVQYKLTSSDVSSAIKAQNAQVSVGSLGAMPAVKGQRLDVTLNTRGRLQTVEEFSSILLRVDTDGSRVHLSDVARVELGSESYAQSSRYNGRPAAGFAIMMAEGANALDTVKGVKAKMDELSAFFPKGMKVVYPMDTAPFVEHSIIKVVETLVEAIVLVFLVMYLFLGNIRATLIPTLAVPVVMLGTFGVLSAAGFSLNTLTLFGMVLAIGLLVDDAIVVVENVERVMEEEGLSARAATRKSMGQISGALVGIGIVICSAFVPMAFFGNSSGVIYRQFSVTVATSVALSVVMALIFSPALCATLLKPSKKGALHQQRGFLGWFNRTFNRTADRYSGLVRRMLDRTLGMLIVYAGIIVAVVLMYRALPTGFLPSEDKGVLMVMAQLPSGSTTEQSQEVGKKLENIFMTDLSDSVDGMFVATGFSFNGSGQNQVASFIRLKDWSERTKPNQSAEALQGRAMGELMKLHEAQAFALVPAPIQELSNTGGFSVSVIDNAGLGLDVLKTAQAKLISLASQDKRLSAVRSGTLADKAEIRLDVDYEKAGSLGVSIGDLNTELSNVLGSSYVDDFIDKGRVKKVYMQADAPFRMLPEDVRRWYIRNTAGDMVPLSAFVTIRWEMGEPKRTRFDGRASLAISGQAASGYSTGEAMKAIEELSKQLPAGVGLAWTGSSYEERLSGSNTAMLYTLALLLVFLSLASLYESWAIPFSVIMDIPLGALGVLLACTLRGMENDIYFQIGFVTIIGLSAKNAILVVEFAKEGYDKGASLIDATVHAVRQRLRPVMMTSIAFALGVLPLAISTGVGAGSQNAVGTGVLGGAITTTLLGLFFVPLYFVTVLRLFRVKPRRDPDAEDDHPTLPDADNGKESSHV
jgi:hydrophobe/amphiphile efflux-1 (HAE1) family protein